MKKKIAIVGSGISGLTAGFLLHKLHDITLFEAAPVLGGHTATVDVSLAGRSYRQALDNLMQAKMPTQVVTHSTGRANDS